MGANLTSPLRLLLVACACLWPGHGYAERWEEHRAAALRALEAVDYAKAIEQVEAAIYYARALPAADRDIAALWENLTALSLADRQYRRAWDSIARWDRVLAANAGHAWAATQQARRDQMTRILFELTRRERGEDAVAERQTSDRATDPGAGPADSPSYELAPAGDLGVPEAAPANGSEAYAIHLASYGSEADARQGWAALEARYPDLLSGKRLDLEWVDLGDRGTFVRLFALPFADAQSAGAACADLRRRAQYCAVVTAD